MGGFPPCPTPARAQGGPIAKSLYFAEDTSLSLSLSLSYMYAGKSVMTATWKLRFMVTGQQMHIYIVDWVGN